MMLEEGRELFLNLDTSKGSEDFLLRMLGERTALLPGLVFRTDCPYLVSELISFSFSWHSLWWPSWSCASP